MLSNTYGAPFSGGGSGFAGEISNTYGAPSEGSGGSGGHAEGIRDSYSAHSGSDGVLTNAYRSLN